MLADETCHESPDGWAKCVAASVVRWQASCVVVEVNSGGELVTQVLRAARSNLPIRTVNAHTGKHTRAEPVALLYERGLVSHVGSFPSLEDEYCTWVPGASSPDRLDAWVWAIVELDPGDVFASAPLTLVRPGGSPHVFQRASGYY
jgi:phage terminase large subunit-like protein